jgi:hypothetical protein
MAKQKSPNTETQQDTHFAQTDVNPDELAQSAGGGEEYENREGAQTGGKRSPRTMPGSAHPHNTEDQSVAYEGSLASRTSDDDNKQGVTTNASSKEAEGQRKVVSEREDAQAGVNHSNKIPPR